MPLDEYYQGPMAFHRVEVAVTIIASGKKILAFYNPRWGSFTLPMTRRKKWQDPAIPIGVRDEEWRVSAARAAAEILGRTFGPDQFPKHVTEIREYRQSGEDGIWKIYEFQVFGLSVAEGTKPVAGEITTWLEPAEFAGHEPVSSTARYVVSVLDERGLLPPWG